MVGCWLPLTLFLIQFLSIVICFVALIWHELWYFPDLKLTKDNFLPINLPFTLLVVLPASTVFGTKEGTTTKTGNCVFTVVNMWFTDRELKLIFELSSNPPDYIDKNVNFTLQSFDGLVCLLLWCFIIIIRKHGRDWSPWTVGWDDPANEAGRRCSATSKILPLCFY